METVEERHGMTVPVGMTVWRTMRTHGTYPGTITRTGWPVRMVMSGTIVGTVSVIRTMIVAGTVVAWVVVARTMVRPAISAGTVVIALVAGMLRPVAAGAVMVTLIAGAVVSVTGAVMVTAILMTIISGATMRRTRCMLACSVA